MADDSPPPPAGRADGVWCVVVAAGSGTRFGSAKQFDRLGAERVVDRAVGTAARVCDGVVVVLPAESVGTPDAEVPGAERVVAGGATRSESGRRGLAAVPAGVSVVLVHDAARPLATDALFRRVVETVQAGADAVVPVVPVVDTVRSVDGGVVDRGRLRAVQTPQGFRAEVLRAAHETGAEASDDAGLVEASGATVVLVEGERHNLKLTEPADLVLAEALIGATGEGSGEASPYRDPAAGEVGGVAR